MYAEFDGKNIPELIRKYRLSQTTIYAILRQQRALHRKRYQKELPLV
ncbi:hypothetical protein AAUPMB_21192 [Pasteurella multocida subsp. multocida str. Anand1_buffalo]|nr:hypothetical protein AAUPMB_21192 [Pasteurella multocida subsp. multocida str. Anand1_buffalo]